MTLKGLVAWTTRDSGSEKKKRGKERKGKKEEKEEMKINAGFATFWPSCIFTLRFCFFSSLTPQVNIFYKLKKPEIDPQGALLSPKHQR